MNGTLRTLSLPVALFVTGASALVYEVAWGRMLRSVFGVGDLAVAAVLGAYFLGLGFGALGGGRLAGRLKRPAIAYAVLEAFVAIYAVCSLGLLPLIRDGYLYVARDASFSTVSALRLGLALVVLLPPTLAMGATMPVILATTGGRDSPWASRAAILYAVNTLGAMAGAAAAGFWLIPTLGVRHCVMAAAFGGAAAATIVIALWRDVLPAASPEEQGPTRGPAARPALAAFLVCVGGFVSLASEVLWTRVLGLVVHGTTQAFASMLVVFLLGIALGSAASARLVRAATRPALAFALTQVGVAFGTLWAMLAVAQVPRVIALVTHSQDLAPNQTWVLLVCAVLTLGPLALSVGATVPIAWRLAGGSDPEISRSAGAVLCANTLGGLAGALVTALFLIPSLGIDLTAVALLAPTLSAVAVAARADCPTRPAWRAAALLGPTLAYALVLMVEPSVQLPYLLRARELPVEAVFGGPYSQNWSRPIVFRREGKNTTVTIQKIGTSSLRLLNDGRPESGMSNMPPGFGPELALLGTLPTLRARRTGRAAVIGLGAGHVVRTLVAGGWRQVEAIELESVVVEAARYLHRVFGRPFPLDNRRVTTIVDDGRARIAASAPGRYDAVVSQPSHPWLSGSSALYTRDFFLDVRRALGRDGAFVLWVNRFRMDLLHLRQIVATLSSVFPSVEGYGALSDCVLVARASTRPIDVSEMQRRVEAAPELLKILSRREIWPLDRLVVLRELDARSARAFGRGQEVITDDRPSLEYELSSVPSSTSVGLEQIDRALRSVSWRPMTARDMGESARWFLARIDAVPARMSALERIELGLGEENLPQELEMLVSGALADARGQTDAALRAYSASNSPLALERRVKLLTQDGNERAAVESVRLATDATPAAAADAAVAAVVLGQWSDARLLAERAMSGSSGAGRIGPPEGASDGEDDVHGTAQSVLTIARVRSVGPCDADAARSLSSARLPSRPELLWSRAQCALEAGFPDEARELFSRADVARRAEAVRMASQGMALLSGGNERLGIRFLERTLRLNPAHGAAASALARVHARRGHKDRAARVLQEAHRWAGGLPRTTEQILATADELGIRIEGAVSATDREAASARPSPQTADRDEP